MFTSNQVVDLDLFVPFVEGGAWKNWITEASSSHWIAEPQME